MYAWYHSEGEDEYYCLHKEAFCFVILFMYNILIGRNNESLRKQVMLLRQQVSTCYLSSVNRNVNRSVHHINIVSGSNIYGIPITQLNIMNDTNHN